MGESIVKVRNLVKHFPVKGKFNNKHVVVKAIDGVTFNIEKGETFGLVGESGCGKSTLGRSILRLIEPTKGEIYYKGEDILGKSRKQMRELRKELQIIFQDPYSSLNPRMTVAEIVGEGAVAHKLYKNKKDAREHVSQIIEICGLERYHINRYPHQFSGGQRQRIGIARALSLNPQFIVADEPVSALDVSVQAQIINLMMRLQDEMGLAYLFISHDLSVIKHISDRIGVMYLGSLVEVALKHDIYKSPLHPYTKALLSVIPKPNPKAKIKMTNIKGEIPSNTRLPKGCKFHTRCPYATDRCKKEVPNLREIDNQHYVACHIV